MKDISTDEADCPVPTIQTYAPYFADQHKVRISKIFTLSKS
jgi:hypothetical protein